MKKLVVDRSKCNACGACTLEEIKILQEDSSGIVDVIGEGIVSDSEVEKIKGIVSLCPTGALSLFEYNEDGKKRLEELKIKIQTPLEFVMPNKEEYEFSMDDRDKYGEEVANGFGGTSGEWDYDYNSASSARSAGERAFRDEIYSQYEAIAQQIIVMYEQRKMNRVARFAEINSNYKYSVHQRLIHDLKSYVNEIEACTGKNLSLPSDFFKFRTKDTEYIIHMQESHNEWLAGRVREHMPSASEFNNCVEVEKTQEYVTVSSFFGKDKEKLVNKYAYLVSFEKAKKFYRQVARATWKAGKYTSKFCEEELNKFHREIENEWKDKISYLMRQI